MKTIDMIEIHNNEFIPKLVSPSTIGEALTGLLKIHQVYLNQIIFPPINIESQSGSCSIDPLPFDDSNETIEFPFKKLL